MNPLNDYYNPNLIKHLPVVKPIPVLLTTEKAYDKAYYEANKEKKGMIGENCHKGD